MQVPCQSRRILLMDADAFFVAVARQEDPEGAGRARFLIVGGRPGSRGVVCSASYECRGYGVRSAMPIAKALRLCPEAMCVPVPRDACLRRSREIQAVLARFIPVVEAASIDEWYGDLGGTEALYGEEPLAHTAHRVRTAVHAATGLWISIGVGTSRLVAKMAVERAKPRPGTDAAGVFEVRPGDEAAFLATCATSDVPGIGPRFAARLHQLGLDRIADAQRWSEVALTQALGPRAGSWLYRRVRGLDDTPVEARAHRLQVSREDTFPADLVSREATERELQRLAIRVSADLRKQALRARTVTVKHRTADFRTHTAQRTLERSISSDRGVFRVARPLLRQLQAKHPGPVRLLGIALSHLMPHEAEDAGDGPPQLALFAPPNPPAPPVESPRDLALSHALDRIRGRFGDGAILPAHLVDTEARSGPPPTRPGAHPPPRPGRPIPG